MTVILRTVTLPAMKNARETFNIAYLEHNRLSMNGVDETLRYLFEGHNVFSVSVDALDHIRHSEVDVLLLPGSKSEHSPYPDFFSVGNRNHDLRASIESRGMLLMTLCGASFLLTSYISYETIDGVVKERPGMGYSSCVATQAFREVTRPQYDVPRHFFNDYIEAAVSSPYHRTPLKLLNVNGPAFHFNKNDAHPNRDILLKYLDIHGAAAFTERMGAGMIAMLGVHPELSSDTSDRRGALKFPHHDRDRIIFLDILKKKFFEFLHAKNHSGQSMAGHSAAEFNMP